MTVRWKFTDLYSTIANVSRTYTLAINPNTGGTPTIAKNLTSATSVGPRRAALVQEGTSAVAEMSFSGVILTQEHLEALERWFDKRSLIQVDDDLGRSFKVVFSSFQPSRERKPYNPWYHTFTATMTVVGYRTASGTSRYGQF